MNHRWVRKEEKLEDFRCLVAGLGQDAGLRVEVHIREEWSFNPVGRVVHVPASGLAELGIKACAGILAHEIGHYYLSRYHLFRQMEDFADKAVRLLINAVEDSRTDHWMGLRYPGVVAWRAEAIRANLPEAPPPCTFLLFCAIASVHPFFGDTCPWMDSPGAPDVNEALLATREARERYRACIPEAGVRLDGNELGLLAAYEREAVPLLRAAGAKDARSPREMKVLLEAARAFVIFRDQLLPAVEPLLAADARQLARLLAEDGHASTTKVRVTSVTTPLIPFSEPTRPRSDAAFQEQLQLHLEMMERAIEERTHAELLKSLDPFEEVEEVMRPVSYERVAEKMKPQTRVLAESLLRSLPPSRRQRYAGGRRSGHRADLRRLMASQADTRQIDRVWMQRTRAQRSDAAVLLLVDLSGSMRGSKIEAAVDCVVMIAEALERAVLRWAIAGFQDELFWVRRFGEPFGSGVKRRVEAMVKEVFDCNPHGHNHAGWNDDGPCLLAAASALEKERADWRILIVISDGEPAGRHSKPRDLREAVRAIQNSQTIDVLVGIGAGPETEHVNDFYPWSVADVPVDELAHQVAWVVDRALAARLW